jgi:hypothetical protein
VNSLASGRNCVLKGMRVVAILCLGVCCFICEPFQETI